MICYLIDNWNSKYLKKDEVVPGMKAGSYKGEVRSDITTSFFILLAIFFPSVTGGFIFLDALKCLVLNLSASLHFSFSADIETTLLSHFLNCLAFSS